MEKKVYYGFKTVPTKLGKKLGVPIMAHAPYLSRVHWSKSRAKKEAEYFINNYKARIGLKEIPVKKLLRAKIQKLGKVI